jgi:hypothetical protein
MGIWERSPAGLALATANQDLQAPFAEVLPDLQTADVIGSPYSVRGYVADAATYPPCQTGRLASLRRRSNPKWGLPY